MLSWKSSHNLTSVFPRATSNHQRQEYFVSFVFLSHGKMRIWLHRPRQRLMHSPRLQHGSLSSAAVSRRPQEIQSRFTVAITDELNSIPLKYVQLFGSQTHLSFLRGARSMRGTADHKLPSSRKRSRTCPSASSPPAERGISQPQLQIQFSYLPTSTKII